jgi:predicted peptidase
MQNMIKRYLLMIITVVLLKTAAAQDLSLYEKHFYINKTDTLPWRLLLPENYDPSKKYPLIFFLHGAGERGNDNEKQLVHGAKLFLQPETRKNFPAIVVFPQCAQNSFWSNVGVRTENGKRVFSFNAGGEPTISMKLADELLKEIIKKFPVEKKQVYVGGLSMGGMGTFEIVRRNPKLFAAALPICGGGAPSTASKLVKTKWWVFHGAKDDVVLPMYSEQMVAALKDAGALVKFTLYPDANHNSWDAAFAEPGLLTWLFSQHK